MALVTLQTIFQDAFPAYEQRHALPAHVRRAAHAIMPCRTAALGGHVQACPDGHMARIWYNSCRHRSCPQCAYLQTERWLVQQQTRLLACDHYHVIFTLPHALNPLWLANVPRMTTLLFQAVRDTLGTLLADPKYLGAQPGILMALHTWSQTLVLHQHLSLSRLNHRHPRVQAHPEIVQGATELHHQITDPLLPQTNAVLHNAAALDTAAHR